MKKNQKRVVIAVFHPQAWLNDHAIEVDPQGDTAFDVTPEIEAMGREHALALKDDQYNSDNLCDAASAPDWVKDWVGPFWIEVEEQIVAYYTAKIRQRLEQRMRTRA